MANKKVYLIRHGETDYNRRRIIQGSGVDAPLNENGISQAQAFYEAYGDIPFEIVISSTLQRTVQTISPFIEDGIQHERSALINEINWGVHEGKVSSPAMVDAYKEMIAAWADGDLDASLPQGESARELLGRLQQFIDHLAIREEELILVCSHGRAIRGLVSLFKNMPPEYMEVVKHANTGLYLLERSNENWEFVLENETAHL